MASRKRSPSTFSLNCVSLAIHASLLPLGTYHPRIVPHAASEPSPLGRHPRSPWRCAWIRGGRSLCPAELAG